MGSYYVTRRSVIRSAAAGAGALALGRKAWAQTKPEKLVMIGTPGSWTEVMRQESIPAWESKTGIKVELTLLPVDPLKTRLRTELAGGTARYDLIIWTGEWRGWIQNYIDDQRELLASVGGDPIDWDDFAQPALGFATYQGKSLGLPYRATAMMLHYNKPVLEQAGITAAPGTFAELQAAAVATTKGDRYGLGIFGKQGGAIVNGWIPFLFSAGGKLYDEETYEIFVNDPVSVESLQFYGDLVTKHKVVPPESLTWEWDEIIAGGQNDRYAMAIMHAPYAAALIDPKASKTATQWAWSQMPGKDSADMGHSWILGWSLSIPQGAKNKEWAADLLRHITSEEQMRRSLKAGNLPPRKSVLHNPEVVSTIPWAADAASALDRAMQVPGDEMYDTLEARLRPAISEVLLGQKTAQQALDGVASDWERSLRRAGLGN